MKFLDSSLLNYIKALKLEVIPNKFILHLSNFYNLDYSRYNSFTKIFLK